MARLIGLLLSLLSALVAWLGVAAGSVAAVEPTLADTEVYAFDSLHRGAGLMSATTERGPRTTTDEYIALRSAVDTSSLGSSACPQPGLAWTENDYDHPVQLAQGDRARLTTRTASGGHAVDLRVASYSRCAAKSGDELLDADRIARDAKAAEVGRTKATGHRWP